MSIIKFAIFDSSFGNILFVSKDDALTNIRFFNDDVSFIKSRFLATEPDAVESVKSFLNIVKQLDNYMKGERIDFHEIHINLSDLPDFTQKVLKETRKIPYGEVRTYGFISKRLGYKNAARAVGQALKINPIPIIIPCHRVIREDRLIGGYALGINIKQRLLAIEGIKI
ncbi:MAG TPA: methylated-DNA--[protein]-cysteine S-methyltransferase [Syntrophorhabdaceae bacterium]|nr:methylated-DNA--[protein]-cysteine S-methyltransferase [Syntrophorhabdaceae bacterium]HPP06031.1 methylated-DNA--[protein]-cysteine S-methyltransferase [Syntrophorhabdaceae bacterium]